MPTLIPTLITQGLHYCCPWAFFQFFHRTPVIAARLGVGESTVRAAKAKVKCGEWKCEQRANCMKQQVRVVKILGKKELGL